MNARNQVEELKNAMKHPANHRLYERYQAVYLFSSGYTRLEIANIINRSWQTL